MGNKSFCNPFHYVGINLLYMWKTFNAYTHSSCTIAVYYSLDD